MLNGKYLEHVEKLFLLIIGLFTMYAMGQEMFSIAWIHREVNLRDLLLMFIYAEVLGMVYVFYTSHELPIQYPLFIGMTSITRSIILEGGIEGSNAANVLYQSSGILILAIATFVVKYSIKKS